ncbi:DNA phosphorothioation system sulfurtransferase DndC [Ruminococcus flavefaciens]|uniref:DNA phosphorothioation system sulfurtransferase DndC n=1 Tax=Ruminococcus flavefaciens TaxID=1265 RepID=UPI000309D316|nr:DNA phosphorothioation system sulfurtransferase DndC [Ruminococcus flavefaciens]
MNSFFDVNSYEELIDEIRYVYKSDDRPWIIGYSGGKDSTTVVELVYEMLLSLAPNERCKNVYIVSSDTLIENPLIKIYLNKMNTMLGEAAARDGLPIKSCMVTPEYDNTYWTNIIGKGLPTPRMNGTFRWCTDRLKIKPSADKIKSIMADEEKEVIVLLGVRKAESIARKRRIEGRELVNRMLNRHETIPDAYVYNPIVELKTDDVWKVLLEHNGGKTPWGSDNSELVSLYSDADSGECPFAGMSNSGQTQSCGQSRFGCWCCTVVKDDKSLNGFIKAGHRELIPLAEFRSWLMSIRDLDEYREKKHRDGTVYADKHGNKGYGPFTWEARKMILSRLIETQQKINYELITLDELRAIDEIWDRELDLSRRALVDLYNDLTGEKLPWDSYKEPLINSATVEGIEEMCSEFNVPSELVRNLLLSVHQNKNYSNPKIMRQDLERLLNQQWLHFDILREIENADNETGT